MVSKHFEFLFEKKIEYLLLKPEFASIDFSNLNPNFICELIDYDIFKKYEDPEVENYLSDIYSTKENVKEFAKWIEETNDFKKTFLYYEEYGKVVEHKLSNDNRIFISPQRAWQLLTSQLHGNYMYSNLIKYIKDHF